MIPWELLDSVKVPGSEQQMTLHRRGDEYSIRVGNIELMNSRMHGSEEALAELACRPIAERKRARILVGGLGMGYTLAAVLRSCGRDASVIVSELVPAVVKWNRGPLAGLAGKPMEDRRVSIRETDVGAVMREKAEAWDAILLDVDNGPEALTQAPNHWLYGPDGLRAAHGALTKRGILGIWSAGASTHFTKRLSKAGFEAEEVVARARGSRGGARHTIWLATKR